MRDSDDFSDVPEATAFGGIFAGEGLADLNSAKTKLTRDGLRVETKCERCGRPKHITVEFLEMMFIAHGRTPPDWFYDREHGLMRWARGCACSDQVKPYPFGITPNECSQGISKAVNYQYLSAQQADQLRQQVLSQPMAR
jgi:hypothetical protein